MKLRSRTRMTRWVLVGGLLCLLLLGLGEGFSWWHGKEMTPAPGTTPVVRTTGTVLPNCFQPPAKLDLLHATAQDLVRYGLPPRPFSLSALPEWLLLVKQFKHRSCQITFPTSGKIHGPARASTSTSSCPSGACQNPTWAGAQAQGQGYEQVQASWTVPCISRKEHDTSSSAWVGLGGVEASAPLVQTGIDSDVDPQGEVIYQAWAETYIAPSATHLYRDYQVLFDFTQGLDCGDRIYAAVSSDSSGRFDAAYPGIYILGNLTTGEYAYDNPDWPATDGSSVEWIVEQPTFMAGQSVRFKPLTDFGTLTFTLCLAYRADQGLQFADALPLQLVNMQGSSLPLATPTRAAPASLTVQWLRGR